MVVKDLNLRWPDVSPGEADSVLVVDPDAELSFPVPFQRFQSVCRRNPEILQRAGRIQQLQFSPCDRPEDCGARPTRTLGVASVEDVLCARIAKRVDHGATIARISGYVNDAIGRKT